MRTCLLLSLSILITMSLTAAPVHNADQAVNQLKESLYADGIDAIAIQVWGPVSAGVEVNGTRERILVTPAPGYIVYVDPFPTANLFHPVRYIFVSEETGELTIVEAQSPPENYRDYQKIETAIGRILASALNRRPSIPKDDPPPVDQARYAVLMNGGYDSGNNHVRYWNDLSNIYIALNWTYGYADENIIVLCSDGLNPAPDQSNGQNSDPDLDGDGDDDIMYSCVLAAVDAVFDSLANLLTESDELFIFSTDHGSSNGGWNTSFNLWNHEVLYDYHFAELLDALPQCPITCTFEPCYSGGFLDNVAVAPGPRIASSACTHDQVSWAMPPDYMYDTYVFHWTAAVKGEDAYGVPVDADYNNDGIITMDEAYRYAEENDQSNEDPQYAEYPLGIGAATSLWPTGSGPFLVVSNEQLDDIGGNNNGSPDPGETVSMELTITNVGSGIAANISGTLTTSDPYLTITQNVSYYPDLGQFQQGVGSPLYMLDISSSCPQGQTVNCNLHIEADSAYTNDVIVSFIVGNPLYDPVGPDAYGYYAFDLLDQPQGPVYNWIEISPAMGGPGQEITALTGRDDNSTLLSLPFTFQYYGVDYSDITVCTNGWLAMGNAAADSDWSNSQIPNSDGPPNMIAPFWEDMNLETGGQISSYYNAVEGTFIVEYFRVPQWSPATALETFEVILYDPAMHPTVTGDGKILFQYNTINDPTECTVGIENSDETIGLQYLFDNTYDEHAAPVQNESAILFTTLSSLPDVTVELTPYGIPIQIPAAGGQFSFNIAVTNNESSSQNFDVWCDVTLPSGGIYGPVLGPANVTLPGMTTADRDRNQAVPAAAPAGTYSYNAYVGMHPSVVWATDSFTFEKLTTGDGAPVSEWANWGEEFANILNNTASLPESVELFAAYPNPFNPKVAISYQLPATSLVNLRVYDIAGREVAELVNGWRDAGQHEVIFDASNLASGVYLYQLQADGRSLSGKMVLIK